jgi:hypothetical protein
MNRQIAKGKIEKFLRLISYESIGTKDARSIVQLISMLNDTIKIWDSKYDTKD